MRSIPGMIFGPVLGLILIMAIADTVPAEDTNAEGYEINNSITGTWFDPDRNGEGLMIDVANHGVVVVTYSTYDTSGNQFWVVGVGNVDGSVITIDNFITTDGGIYGEYFDPSLVNRYVWGSGTFTFTDCATGHVEFVPNPDFSDEFEPVTMDIVRLTVPVNCGPN